MLSPEIILIVKSSIMWKPVINNASQTHLHTMHKTGYYTEIQQKTNFFPLPYAVRAANNGC